MDARKLWVDPSFPVALSPGLLEDLDFTRFFPRFLGMEEDRAAAWIAGHLCAEAEEIARRNGRVQAMLGVRGALDTLKALHAQTCGLEEARAAVRQSQGLLAHCTCLLTLFQSYLHAVACACEALAVLPGFEDVSEWLRDWRASQAHCAIEAGVRRASETFQPMRSATIRCSLREAGDALAFSIEGVEEQDEFPVSLLDSGGRAVNSLLPPVPFRIRNDLVHLEAFVIRQVEAQWKSRLAAAERSLWDLPVETVEAWIEAMRPMAFYLVALDLAHRMAKDSHPLCRPVRDSQAFRFEELHSPHLILQSQPSVPYTHWMQAPALALITGANHAGKTTFLKTLAQNCLFAQMGFLVPAKAFAFPFSKSMHTVFAAGESVGLDRSRFEQEALALREAIRLADPDALLWLNEPFTSTNPAEAADMLADALRAVWQRGASLCCVTHLYEVYDRLNAAVPLQSLVVEREEGPEGLSFRLEDKAPDGISYARAVAEAFGINAERYVQDPGRLGRIQAFLRKGALS